MLASSVAAGFEPPGRAQWRTMLLAILPSCICQGRKLLCDLGGTL